MLMDRTDADVAERGWLLLRLATLLRYADRRGPSPEEALAAGGGRSGLDRLSRDSYVASSPSSRAMSRAGCAAMRACERPSRNTRQERFRDPSWRENLVYWLAYQGR